MLCEVKTAHFFFCPSRLVILVHIESHPYVMFETLYGFLGDTVPIGI
jgi:hypothetical protein